ncbi:transposase [Moorena sp. SIO4G3]|uniref:transposase n=1 Tax=Moorena sp. SIO4G3 TaxID=2607821 RepID=UPI00344262BD
MRKEYAAHLKRFYWSEKPMFWGGSYALITVGTQAPLEKLIAYVQNQEKPE